MPRIFHLILILLALAPATSAEAGHEPVRISNEFLRVGIDPRDGQLLELGDGRNGHNFFGATNGHSWELDLFPASSGSIKPSDAKQFDCKPLEADVPGLRLTWSGFGRADAPGLRVEATVRLERDSPVSRWNIAVASLGELRLAQVRFPRVLEFPAQENETFAVPGWMGQMTTRLREMLSPPGTPGSRMEWEYPGRLSLQCLALYQPDGPGFYAACDDTNASRKSFAVFGDDKRNVSFEVIQFPENTVPPPARYSPPYDVLLGTFEGDWLTAAERYRAWATNQVWAKESRLKRGRVADWARDTSLWVWNRGRSENVLPPAVALQKELDRPVSVFWHWWHGCPYDVGFPEYLPPREGAESFQRALSAAHKKDVHAIVYMNQRLWGMTTESWTNENAATYAVKGLDGQIHPEVYNTFTRSPCASMCMGTEFWRQKYAGIGATAWRTLGIDGIYMDQACSSLACFDPEHDHPLGGGTYWIKGFQKLAADIRHRCDDRRRIVLAGEGCGEAWLPHLDLMLSLQVSLERYARPGDWEPIPFFHAVYHGYAIFYGNYSSLTMPPYDELWPEAFAPKEPLMLLDQKFSRQFYLEQARSFVWGQQPTIANFRPHHLEERPREIDYLLRLAKTRARATKYLQEGTFLRAPELNAAEAELDMSRLSIYAGQRGGLTEFTKSFPTILAGAWQSSDGNIAVAVASITDEPQPLSFTLDSSRHPLPDQGSIYRIDSKGRKRIGRFSNGKAKIDLALSGRDICVLELVKDR